MWFHCLNSEEFFKQYFQKSIFKITKYSIKVFSKYQIKYCEESILKIQKNTILYFQNKILFSKYYFAHHCPDVHVLM